MGVIVHRSSRRRAAQLGLALLLALPDAPNWSVRAESADSVAARAATALRDLAGSYLLGLADHVLPNLAALPAPERAQELRRLLEAHVDLPGIARFALGRSWRGASEDERAEFVQLFRELVVRTSEGGLANYSSHELRIAETRPTVEPDEVVVRSELTLKGGPPLQVDWWLRRDAGGFRILDVAVESVSVRIALRDYMSAAIQERGGTMPALLEALRALARGPVGEAR